VILEGSRGAARLDELSVRRTDHGVLVECERAGVHVDLVEHLLAALGGLSLRDGVAIGVDGGEVPLLGGGAVELATALLELEVPARPPTLIVGRSDTLLEGPARYEFRTGASTELFVAVDFPGVGKQTAHWDGTPDAFKRVIAPARTFGFLRDADALRRVGRAAHVDPNAVLILDDEGDSGSSEHPMEPDELARHKLLDLIGDFTLYGGPPAGTVRAERPGHSATHRVVGRALASGVLVRRDNATLRRA
jgi:UDP-3-O-[3-hydroxymyristoyl] N-acetylglucosamine deacetylase